MKLLSAAQMQELDRKTIEDVGIPGVVLMENAGRALAEQVQKSYATAQPSSVLILAGKGNNGGDGFVIARYLQERGWSVKTLVLADRDAIKGDAAVFLQALTACGGDVVFAGDQDELNRELADCNGVALIIDALFGTGLTKPVTGLYAEAIAWLNNQPAPVVAVDIPSGIDSSTGSVLGCCVHADLTVTFAFAKLGSVSYPGAAHVGELVTVDIGIPWSVSQQAGDEYLLVDEVEAARLLPPRPADGHKGTFGHMLVLAGALGKTGAAVMTSETGLRGGAGLVTLACPAEAQPVLASRLVEVMTEPLPDVGGEVSLQGLDELLRMAEEKQALVMGPGLGLNAEAGGLVRRLLQDCTLPVVVDADGLTALAGHLEVLERRVGQSTVLTPHPGEMARLAGVSVAEIQADRVSAAKAFAARHQVVLVLKGARTLIALPDGRLRINGSGHAGMASGGMGDVLAGLIGSFLAQGLGAADAAVLAVYLHGAAADRLLGTFGDAGMLATDLMRELPAARQDLTRRT